MCTYVACGNISLCFTLIQQWRNERKNMPDLQYFLSYSGHILIGVFTIYKNNQQRKARKTDKAYPFARALMFRLNWSLHGILTPRASDNKSVP